MPRKTRKATFSLHEDVLVDIDEAVAKGAAPSKNAFVEQALVRELKEMRRLARRAQYQQAAQDPLFMKDVNEVETAFESADAETVRRIG